MRRTIPWTAPSSSAATYPATSPLALTPKQRTVLALRYDPAGHPSLSLKSAATTLGSSRAYIAKIEQRAIYRLDALARAVADGLPLPAQQAADWRQFEGVWRDWHARVEARAAPE